MSITRQLPCDDVYRNKSVPLLCITGEAAGAVATGAELEVHSAGSEPVPGAGGHAAAQYVRAASASAQHSPAGQAPLHPIFDRDMFMQVQASDPIGFHMRVRGSMLCTV